MCILLKNINKILYVSKCYKKFHETWERRECVAYGVAVTVAEHTSICMVYDFTIHPVSVHLPLTRLLASLYILLDEPVEVSIDVTSRCFLSDSTVSVVHILYDGDWLRFCCYYVRRLTVIIMSLVVILSLLPLLLLLVVVVVCHCRSNCSCHGRFKVKVKEKICYIAPK